MQRDTHFQILSDIEYPGNIKRALFVEVPERVSEICRLDLPYPHEDQLMVWMTAQKHSEKLAGILQAYLVPVGVLKRCRRTYQEQSLFHSPALGASPYEQARH